MEPQWVSLVSQVGFPILMTLWFMFRLERRWDLLFELMTKKAEILRIIHDYIVQNKGNNTTQNKGNNRRKDND